MQTIDNNSNKSTLFVFNLCFDHLIDTISYLDITDILNCELVNKSWKKSVEYHITHTLKYAKNVYYLSYKQIKRKDKPLSDKDLCIRSILKRPKGLVIMGGSFSEGKEQNCFYTHDLNSNSIYGGPMIGPWKAAGHRLGSYPAVENKYGFVEVFGGYTSMDFETFTNTGTHVKNRSSGCDFTQLKQQKFAVIDEKPVVYNHFMSYWEYQRPIPKAMCFTSATTLIDGAVCLTGGGTSPYRECTVYNECYIRRQVGVYEAWESIAPMSTTRCGHASVTTFNNEIVVMGGYQGGTEYLSSCEIYDTTCDQWRALPSMSLTRSGFIAVTDMHGSIVVSGGSPDGTKAHSSTARLGKSILYAACLYLACM